MDSKPPVTVSYTRNLSHSLYGGMPYETSSFFISIQVSPEEEGDVRAAFEEARTKVMEQIHSEIGRLQGGLPYDEFQKFLYDYVANRPVGVETYNKMGENQQAIIQTIKRAKATAKRDNNKTNENNRNGAKDKPKREDIQVVHTGE